MTRLRAASIVWLSVVGACSGPLVPPAEEGRIEKHAQALISTAICPPGSNVIVGTDGPDVLVGTSGVDCIVGGPGNDRIQGGGGNDILVGDEGDDILQGDNGDDLLLGGAGNDQLDGGNGQDRLEGGDGNDLLLGGNGNDQLSGDNGHDVLVTGNGVDTASGGAGDDVIDGGNGGDTVTGGDGVDQCTGVGCETPERPVATCTSDASCGVGLRCSATGLCVACLADLECDDANVCTADSCQPVLGCRRPPVPNGTPCLDATVCNGAEQCVAGTCTAGPPLVCDDGLFCNGAEFCTAVTGCHNGTPPAVTSDGIACTVDQCNESVDAIVHVPNDALCPAGFSCGGSGCQNINECATGAHDCSVNATCTDEVPGTFPDGDGGSIIVPPFRCTCNPGFSGDGRTCDPVCGPVTLPNGAVRCVKARADSTVDFRFTATDPVWKEEFVQGDEPVENYCGPTAIKNFLFWHGESASYSTLGSEMHTNTWDTAIVAAAVFAAGPLIGCVELISCAIVIGIVSDIVVKAGTLPGDMLGALDRRAPPGFVACIKNGDNNLETVRSALADGNPVVFLESRGGSNLHWAVLTGLFRDGGGTLNVRVANTADRTWDQFVTDWSLSPVGDGAMRALLGVLGLHAHTMIRWIPAAEASGNHCP